MIYEADEYDRNSFKFFKDLKQNEEKCVYRDKNIVIVKAADGSYKGIAWNLTLETKQDVLGIDVCLPAFAEKRVTLLTKTVDEECCNPLKLWHDLGEPANLKEEQIELLKGAANPLTATKVLDGSAPKFTLNVNRNGVVYFEAAPAPLTQDNGYNYSFYEKM